MLACFLTMLQEVGFFENWNIDIIKNAIEIKDNSSPFKGRNDNAFVESFMKIFKVEKVYIKEYRTFEEAYNNIKEFIEKVYNEKRLHFGVGYLPLSNLNRNF